MSLPARRPSLVLALVVPVAVSALLALVRDVVDGPDAALVLVLVVVGAAATGSRTAGIVAAVSGAVWFDFFLTRPYLTFAIDGRDDIETAVLLTVVGLVVTEIALWGRRQQAGSSRRQGYLTGVVSATGMVAAGSDTDDVVRYAEAQLRELLGVHSATYRTGGPGPHPRIEPDGRVTRDGTDLAVDRTGLPTNDVVELPVVSGNRAVGTIVLTASARVARPTLEERRVAVSLAEVVGSALAARPASTTIDTGRE